MVQHADRNCKHHGITEHYGYEQKTACGNPTINWVCKKCNVERVSETRKNNKRKLVEAFGGKCTWCGYSKYIGALEFHHLTPGEKDFAISTTRISNITKMMEEAKKCVMLCANCHREAHAIAGGVALTIPAAVPPIQKKLDRCPVCGKEKRVKLKTCSTVCSHKQTAKVDWEKVDLPTLLTEKSYEAIGRQLGCTGVAVKKRAKKLGIV